MRLSLVQPTFMAGSAQPLQRRRGRRAVFFNGDRIEALSTTRLRPGLNYLFSTLGSLDCDLVLLGRGPSMPSHGGRGSRIPVDLSTMAAAWPIAIAGVFRCPHRPDVACTCQPPMPGLLHQAALTLRLQMAASWLVSDCDSDIEAGCRAGCRTIAIGKATVLHRCPQHLATLRVGCWQEAAAVISAAFGHGERRRRSTCV